MTPGASNGKARCGWSSAATATRRPAPRTRQLSGTHADSPVSSRPSPSRRDIAYPRASANPCRHRRRRRSGSRCLPGHRRSPPGPVLRHHATSPTDSVSTVLSAGCSAQRLRLYLLRHVVQCRCHQATGGTVIEIDPGLANVPRLHPRAGTDDRPDRQLSCGAGMCPGDQRHTPMVAMTPAGPEPSGRAPWRSWTEAAVITTSRISLVVSTAMCRLRQLTFLALSEPRLG